MVQTGSICRGTGRKLKVWAHARRAQSARKKFGVAPLFGTTSIISRFGECFRDVQYS